METVYSNTNSIDIALWIWFALTAVSVAFVAWDLFTRTPEMKVMKWGWILVTLYTGIIGLIVCLGLGNSGRRVNNRRENF